MLHSQGVSTPSPSRRRRRMAPEPVAAAHLRAARWVSGQRGGAQAAREGTRRQVIGLGGGRPYGCPGPAPEAPASRLSSLRHGRPPLRHLRRAPDHKRGLHLRQRHEENRLLRPADSIEAAEAPSAALSCASRVDDTQEQLGRRAGRAGGERIRPQRHGSPPLRWTRSEHRPEWRCWACWSTQRRMMRPAVTSYGGLCGA